MTQKFHCIICNQDFIDGWEHALTNRGRGFYGGFNKAHSKYGHEIEQSNYEKPCFCGGHITINGTGPESWETTCDNCEFLYDED